MILSDLRSYLKQQHRVALADLVNHFNMDADALRGMLGKWISKGHVRQLRNVGVEAHGANRRNCGNTIDIVLGS